MKIVLAGTGNVAVHLGPALQKAGHQIIQLVGNTENNTQKLAGKLECEYSTNPSDISIKADVVLLAIKDEAISRFVQKVKSGKSLFIHTSGSVTGKILSSCSANYGVLYPVQTFSLKRKIDFSKIPICIEASTPVAKTRLLSLAKSLSSNVQWLSEEQRMIVHLAAVLANNFSNHLFVLAEDLLKKKDIDFEILQPLIAETALKIKNNSPALMQTGPARRGDSATIEKHLEILRSNKSLLDLYQIMTSSIRDHSGPVL